MPARLTCAGCRSGIELVLNSKVQSVAKNTVSVAGPGGQVVNIPFGACVWATGVAMHPLIRQLQVWLAPPSQVLSDAWHDAL